MSIWWTAALFLSLFPALLIGYFLQNISRTELLWAIAIWAVLTLIFFT